MATFGNSLSYRSVIVRSLWAVATVCATICTGLFAFTVAVARAGLAMFSKPPSLCQKQPEVRTGLTARERYDLNGDGFASPRVERSWRMCPSA